jgi:spore coat polysaccharide biosynthesis predicted glycosyltransferase SpsG
VTADAVVVADAAPSAGLGHLSRAGAVAVALTTRGLSVECFALDAAAPFGRDGVEWLGVDAVDAVPAPRPGGVAIVDSYTASAETARARFDAAALVLMHDRGPTAGADLVVSLTADPGPGVLAGPAYACLRPAFWGVPRRTEVGPVESLLVVTGGSGAAVDLGAALAAALPAAAVEVVAGPFADTPRPADAVAVLDAPASLAGPLRRADLVVTAGGQTLLEALACGAPTVAIVTAENQRAQAELLAGLDAAVLVDGQDDGRLVAAATSLAADPAGRIELARRGQDAIDGFGALRVACEVEALLTGASVGR